MEQLSIFDIYKVGVGPSSSHTLGPWRAALAFRISLKNLSISKIETHLYGSLSKTGKGHGTDIAVQLGLSGLDPVIIDTDDIKTIINKIAQNGIHMLSHDIVMLNSKDDIVFHKITRQEHPNTMTFKAYQDGALVLEETYFSLGGGFVEKEGDNEVAVEGMVLPFPIDTCSDVFSYLNEDLTAVSDIVFENELAFRERDVIKQKVEAIIDTMIDSVYRGVQKHGILPGGLSVKRRAKALNDKLLQGATFDTLKDWLTKVKSSGVDFNSINQWVSCFALAVNEENASFGRIVTAPTNGAAGVIPAVLLYYMCFCNPHADRQTLMRYMLTSGEVGSLFKKGATISAAVGGCQAEIGVSSAMAAAGLTEVLGGTPEQVFMAAEIAMEHHLGMTCDPIGGLVQVPCIERNAMGAMKAITACNLALAGNPQDAIVNFDIVVKTMWDTAQEMNDKFKETSEGGLAYSLPVVIPEC